MDHDQTVVITITRFWRVYSLNTWKSFDCSLTDKIFQEVEMNASEFQENLYEDSGILGMIKMVVN